MTGEQRGGSHDLAVAPQTDQRRLPSADFTRDAWVVVRFLNEGRASSIIRTGKPVVVLHSTRLTRGILRIPLLSRKHSGMVMSTAMPHLSSG